MPVSLKVKGIGASKYKSGEFALTIIYIPGLDKEGSEFYISISCELHLVDGLKANILMGNDVLYMEGFAINLSNTSVLAHSFDMKINITTRYHSKFLKHRVLVNSSTLMPPQSEVLIAFQYIYLPNSRNFLFYPSL